MHIKKCRKTQQRPGELHTEYLHIDRLASTIIVHAGRKIFFKQKLFGNSIIIL